MDTLYVGTSLNLTCHIGLHLLLPSTTITSQWTHNDTVIKNQTINIATNSTISHLLLNPLTTGSSGQYTCNVTLSGSSLHYIKILNPSVAASYSISVNGKYVFQLLLLIIPYTAIPSAPVVVILTSLAKPGEESILNCTVSAGPGLPLVVAWTKNTGEPNANNISILPVSTTNSKTNTSTSLIFTSLTTSDAGLYTCTATINISQIAPAPQTSEDVTVSVQSKLKSSILSLTLQV